MEESIREQILQLFESDRYSNLLLGETLNVNVCDLPEEIGLSLVEDFIRNDLKRDIVDCLDEILDPLPVPLVVFSGAPERRMRDISSDDIGKLRTVNGVVMSVAQPRSFIRNACFWCPECNTYTYEKQYSFSMNEPKNCLGCGNSKGFSMIEEKSEWEDYQEIKLQENPEDMEIGVVPRWMRVVLIGSYLIDTCQPGDIVDFTCILRIDQDKRKKDRVFSWYLQGVNGEVLSKDAFNTVLSEEDIEQIRSWASNEQIREILLESIYPSIYGFVEEKYGVTLCLFGGVEKKLRDVLFRGQPNCLLIGDPSTAKTALINAASKVAPKGIYTQAGGASGVGLTAAAVKYGDEWVLEAGAVVLANGGACCIDELEKMSNEDRKKLLECMEIQTVTVHKANIHTTLNAKTAVLAAANPKYGRYDPRYTVAENINLPPPVLARFDLIFIVRDIPEEEKDLKIAERIMETATGQLRSEFELMPPELIKKYILYAKTIKPKIKPRAQKMLIDYFVGMRAQYLNSEDKPIPITARQMQGLVRLTEANARMALKEEADLDDAIKAIELIEGTLHRAAMDPATGLIDTTGLEQGMPKSKSDKRKTVEAMIPIYPSRISKQEIYQQCGGAISNEELDEILLQLVSTSGSNFTESGGLFSQVSRKHF